MMLKKITRKIVRAVQGPLLLISLTIVYFLGFGATLLFVIVFHRRLLRGPDKESDSLWVEAKGYEPQLEENLHQS